jgi:hypothetical protein
MRFADSLSRFRQYLRSGRQRQRPEKFQSLLRLEQLEDRLVPSTLSIDSLGHGIYFSSPGPADNLTLSERIVPTGHGFGIEDVLTDTTQKISVTGGPGTNQVVTHLSSLFVNDVNNNDVVNVQAINYPTTIRNLSPGLNTVNVGNAGSLQGIFGIQAPLGVEDQLAGRSTHLNVDDSKDAANKPNVLLFGGQINKLAPAPISYVFLNKSDSVTISGGSGNNTYTVDDPQAPTKLNTGSGSNHVNVEATVAPFALQGHGGTDQVIISSNPGGSGSLVNIHGSVDVRNTTPSTQLIVDDAADPSLVRQTVSLSDTALVGLAPAPITYQPSGLKTSPALIVIGRENALPPTSPLPDDTFIVTNTPANTVLGLGKGRHEVNVVGLTGGLTIGDTSGPAVQTDVIVGNTAPLSPNPAHGGTLAGIHGLLHFGSSADPVLFVDDSGDATPRTVNLAASSASGTITGLAPGATIQYTAGGQTTVEVFGGSGGNTFNVANTVAAPFADTLLFGGNGGDTFNVTTSTSGLQIATGSGPNHLNIQGNGPNDTLNIDARNGQNTITIGSLAPALGGNLAKVQGGIALDEANRSTALVVDDSSDPAFKNVILNKGLAANVIDFGVPIDFPGGLKSVGVFGGKGGDTFTILNPPGTPVTIHGGTGSNTLVGGNVPNLWNITSTNAGNVGNVAFTSIQNLVGGSGPDTFKFSDQAGVTGNIDGGAGFNVLDYSAYTTHVSVNLGAHKATGGGGSVFNVFNIEGVIGGSGGNTLISGPSGAVLIGGTGGNVLIGGSGRDVLIAGPGSSVLQAGSGEAILIGGTTVWDTNVAALSAIMAEWSHTYDPINPLNDYQIRVGHLEHGGGLNGPFLLNPTTVRSNGAHDVLTTGFGLDFVFFDALDTLTHSQRPHEVFVEV